MATKNERMRERLKINPAKRGGLTRTTINFKPGDVTVLRFKHESEARDVPIGPLFADDWKPFGTVEWPDGTTSPAWFSIRDARKIAADFGVALEEV